MEQENHGNRILTVIVSIYTFLILFVTFRINISYDTEYLIGNGNTFNIIRTNENVILGEYLKVSIFFILVFFISKFLPNSNSLKIYMHQYFNWFKIIFVQYIIITIMILDLQQDILSSLWSNAFVYPHALVIITGDKKLFIKIFHILFSISLLLLMLLSLKDREYNENKTSKINLLDIILDLLIIFYGYNYISFTRPVGLISDTNAQLFVVISLIYLLLKGVNFNFTYYKILINSRLPRLQQYKNWLQYVGILIEIVLSYAIFYLMTHSMRIISTPTSQVSYLYSGIMISGVLIFIIISKHRMSNIIRYFRVGKNIFLILLMILLIRSSAVHLNQLDDTPIVTLDELPLGLYFISDIYSNDSINGKLLLKFVSNSTITYSFSINTVVLIARDNNTLQLDHYIEITQLKVANFEIMSEDGVFNFEYSFVNPSELIISFDNIAISSNFMIGLGLNSTNSFQIVAGPPI